MPSMRIFLNFTVTLNLLLANDQPLVYERPIRTTDIFIIVHDFIASQRMTLST